MPNSDLSVKVFSGFTLLITSSHVVPAAVTFRTKTENPKNIVENRKERILKPPIIFQNTSIEGKADTLKKVNIPQPIEVNI